MLIKKLLLSLFMMISLPAVSMAADTGQAIGSWKVYPTYANPPQKVIETEDMVYYTTGGNLFSYNKTCFFCKVKNNRHLQDGTSD